MITWSAGFDTTFLYTTRDGDEYDCLEFLELLLGQQLEWEKQSEGFYTLQHDGHEFWVQRYEG